jgi:hypothetical protein
MGLFGNAKAPRLVRNGCDGDGDGDGNGNGNGNGNGDGDGDGDECTVCIRQPIFGGTKQNERGRTNRSLYFVFPFSLLPTFVVNGEHAGRDRNLG